MAPSQPEKLALQAILDSGVDIIKLTQSAPSEQLSEQMLREQVLKSLEGYADSCGEWLKQNVGAKAGDQISPALGEQVALLLQQHAQVLAHAKELLSTASQELREFQRRGKGILRYADYLPKSISMAMKQKG